MSRSLRLLIGLLTTAVLVSVSAYWWTTQSGASDDALQASIAVATAMGSDTTGYRRADRVRDFVFPEDHGPHPGFKTEWWYFTGTLTADDGRAFGYQWTLFRVALTPPEDRDSPAGPVQTANASAASSWSTNQFYMGHFAVSDVARKQHAEAERFSRAAAGLAGAQAEPWRVWLDTWSLESTGDAPFPARVRADDPASGMAVDLVVTPQKPRVLQGDRGLSQKGPGAGNASYYYSYTRLATEGTVVAGGDTLSVTGSSWLDREWSTSALGENQVGWDWFSLQLDDGRDLMYYQLRTRDGSPSRFTDGVVVGPDGEKSVISLDDVRLTVTDRWTTPDGSRAYPVAWRLQVPKHDLDLTLTAAFPDQEMDVSVRYWEGAVRVTGSTTGAGYVEMTGYGEEPASRVGG